MPRHRKSATDLPPCVYRKHGAFWLVKAGKWHRLGTDKRAALEEYARRVDSPKGTLPRSLEDWLASVKSGLAANTYSQYRTAVKKLKPILAEFEPQDLQPVHIVKIRQAMKEKPNMANRCLTVLRSAYDYLLEQQLVESNPAVGVKRLKEAKRERLLTADEIERIKAEGSPRLAVIVSIAVLTGQRIGDVLRIRLGDLTDEGIAFRQAKTGARLVVRWSPDLRVAVDKAKALAGPIRALTLFKNRKGKAPDYRTVHEEWTRAAGKAGVKDANLHDLRAYAATTVGKEKAGALLGHASEANTRRYLRSKEVPVVDGLVLDSD